MKTTKDENHDVQCEESYSLYAGHPTLSTNPNAMSQASLAMSAADSIFVVVVFVVVVDFCTCVEVDVLVLD